MMRITSVASALALAMLVASCGSPAEPEVENTEEAAAQTAETAEAGAGAGEGAAEEAVEETAGAEAAEAAPVPAATPVPAPTPSATASPVAVAPVAAAAPVSAPASFNQCKVCHAVEPGKNGIGPTMAGVFNARAGHIAGFDYSKAMLESGLVWNEANLDAYLLDPRKTVPGTKMAFGGVKDAARRKEIIDYLKSL